MSDELATPSQTPTDVALSRVGATHGKLRGLVFAMAWGANIGAMAVLAASLFFDSRFAHAIDATPWLNLNVGALPSGLSAAQSDTLHSLGVKLIAVAATLTTACLAIGLFLGTVRSRGLRSWLAFVGLVAAWLALVGSRHDLSWFGQRLRLTHAIDAFEPVAAALRENWPKHDDAMDPIGPFSAYPAGRPRVLMPLTTPASRPDVAPFGLVERTPAGGLRFELVTRDAGSWLEWHPAGEAPASFVGGLDTRYEMKRSAPLGDGWFLARYDAELDTGSEPAH